MKKSILLILILLVSIPLISMAGDPPPVGGDPTGAPGSVPIGGSAPIGSGLLIIVVMSMLYLAYHYRLFTSLKLFK